MAQQSLVTIKTVDEKGSVAFAAIRVISAADSTRFWSQAADSAGIAVFTLDSGLYTVKASALSYAPVSRSVNIKAGNSTFNMVLSSASTTLKAVVVSASRPLMRQEDDKTIVDPENLAASSTSAYEIIEKTPGLFVDQDGNVYLSSSTPATIYINGREQKMSAADVASMLKSLPPNSIASLEILRTPSAKYDASGGGGIVNVVLKKGIKIGLNGSATAAVHQGRQGNQLIGFNVNNTSGGLSTYLNMQYARRNTSETLRSVRELSPNLMLSQNSYTVYPTDNYYAGFGLTFPVKKRWELSYDGRLNFSDFGNTVDNVSQIRGGSPASIVENNTSAVANTSRSFNLSQGLTAKYKIDSLGSEWSTDFSFNASPGKSQQDYIYTLPMVPVTTGGGDIKTDLTSLSLKTDMVYKLPQRWTAETGLKGTIVSFDTDRNYFLGSSSSQTVDPVRSGAYNYRESISSAYLQISKGFGKFLLKGGLRMEHTDMNGHQIVPSDTSFSVRRTDFFPYVYLSRPVMSIGGFELRAYLVYRRTITRPDYQLLNPSLRYVDQYLYETGNPALRPQFTQNYEANISVSERPIFAVGLNETKDIFTNVIYTDNTDSRVSYRTSDNLGRNKELYFRLMAGIPPGGKYFFMVVTRYNHNLYQGIYEQQPLEFNKGSWMAGTYHVLKLGKLTQLSMHGFVRFKGQQQFYELGNFGMLNLQVNRDFMKKKLMLSLSVNDLFETAKNTFTIEQGSVKASGERAADTRRVGINIRYNFGLVKKEKSNLFEMEP